MGRVKRRCFDAQILVEGVDRYHLAVIDHGLYGNRPSARARRVTLNWIWIVSQHFLHPNLTGGKVSNALLAAQTCGTAFAVIDLFDVYCYSEFFLNDERERPPFASMPPNETGYPKSKGLDPKFLAYRHAIARHSKHEVEVRDVEARLSRSLEQGQEAYITFRTTTYILYSNYYIDCVTMVGKKLYYESLDGYEKGQLQLKRVLSHGDEVEVEVSVRLPDAGVVWEGSITGSWPKSRLPALEKVPVVLSIATKNLHSVRPPWPMTLIFLEDGYLRLNYDGHDVHSFYAVAQGT